jgi:hypothetical protein
MVFLIATQPIDGAESAKWMNDRSMGGAGILTSHQKDSFHSDSRTIGRAETDSLPAVLKNHISDVNPSFITREFPEF